MPIRNVLLAALITLNASAWSLLGWQWSHSNAGQQPQIVVERQERDPCENAIALAHLFVGDRATTGSADILQFALAVCGLTEDFIAAASD